MTNHTPDDDATDAPTAATTDADAAPDGSLPVDAFDGPGSLADDDRIELREETREGDADTVDMFAGVEGVAAVAPVRADGAVLLWEGPRGWTLPFIFVEPGDDWVETAEVVVAELTGVAFDLDTVERARRVETTAADGDNATHHEIVFRTETVGDADAAALDAFEADDEHPDVDWFAEVPADVDQERDVRLFLD